ncbi:hypothetical protein [Streptomyces sp. NPDC020362]|uniref:hypothetical protein n=1 Tax=unclassified Streptomyces TaxID=2593676 RepID=UPI0034031C36
MSSEEAKAIDTELLFVRASVAEKLRNKAGWLVFSDPLTSWYGCLPESRVAIQLVSSRAIRRTSTSVVTSWSRRSRATAPGGHSRLWSATARSLRRIGNDDMEREAMFLGESPSSWRPCRTGVCSAW